MTLRILDLYCCAGGAGMGYHQAGFEVVGVDIAARPRYPFEFIQADVLALEPAWIAGFDAVHASPPCQAHSALKSMHNAKDHPNLIPATRAMLRASGLPYVIENVEGAKAEMIEPVKLCGTMFGLGSGDAELRRHRLFEVNFDLLFTPPCHHHKSRVIGVYGGHGRDRRRTVNTQDFPTTARAEAMGIDWMTGAELSQAIPPAYTRFIGKQLMAYLAVRRAA